MGQLQEYHDALVRLDELLLSTAAPIDHLQMSWIRDESINGIVFFRLKDLLEQMYAVMPESIVKAGKNEPATR